VLVTKQVKRWPSMSVNRGCAPGWGRSLRTITRIPGGQPARSSTRHFLTWARDCGAQQASVTAYAANDAAQRLYARHGFEPASVTLRAIL
jgi:GNAT superfamily N-acetyltransferase